ncbi:MAG: hypothetical protein NTW86_13645 [Candidatus Sumerlaeota bacterium]|nr:hypothetical protein [Candidatus Sumerlaeota bacterium]
MGATLSSRERIQKILRREIPDRVGLDESFWGDTLKAWKAQGYPEATPPHRFFGLDMIHGGGFNLVAFPGRHEVIEETDEWVTAKDANLATMRHWKGRAGTPEHIDFTVRNGETWRAHGFPEVFRTFKPERINLDALARLKQQAREEERFFALAFAEIFELGKNVAGHVNMCIGMIEEPEWIHDMFGAFADMIIGCCDYAFEKIGLPDGVMIFGDMGFKARPFISLAMHNELVLPHNGRIIRHLKAKGLPVIFHSCGFIEPLVPGFIESGIDMLQAMEVKAGCDLRRLKPLYGDKIGFEGNVDVRAMETNDLEKVEEEVRVKVLCGKEGGGYIFHSDHSIPHSVQLKTYQFALECAKKYGTY